MKRIMSLFGIFFICVLFLCPIILLIAYAFLPLDTAGGIAKGTAPFLPKSIALSFEQLLSLFKNGQMYFPAMFISLVRCLCASAFQVAFSVPIGFILAKYRLRVVSFLTLIFTLTIVIPLQMYIIPTYRFLQACPWFPQSLALYLPIALAPFGPVLMRQACLQFPKECAEYFRLESRSFPKLMRYVVFPFCRPYGIVLFLFSFIESWGMVEQPLILISAQRELPFSMILYNMQNEQPQIVFVASLVSLIPFFVLFLAMKRKRNGLIKEI